MICCSTVFMLLTLAKSKIQYYPHICMQVLMEYVWLNFAHKFKYITRGLLDLLCPYTSPAKGTAEQRTWMKKAFFCLWGWTNISSKQTFHQERVDISKITGQWIKHELWTHYHLVHMIYLPLKQYHNISQIQTCIYTYTCKTVRPYGCSILVHLGIHRQKCGKVKHFLSPKKTQIPYKYLKSTQNDAICQPLTRYSVFDLGIPGEDSQGKWSFISTRVLKSRPGCAQQKSWLQPVHGLRPCKQKSRHRFSR